jgi:hypothetical protein
MMDILDKAELMSAIHEEDGGASWSRTQWGRHAAAETARVSCRLSGPRN